MNTSVEYYFVKIFENHVVLQWKASDFWHTLLDYGVENTYQNRQKLYRLLNKKTFEQVLVRHTHLENQQLTTYSMLDLLESQQSCPEKEVHDREAEQVSQQKWEEIHHKKTLLVDELRLAGNAAVDFPNLRPQLAQHIQTLQLEVQELEAYIKFVSNFQ